MRYSISYDLMAPGKDYEPLWTALRGIGAVRILESQWVSSRTNTSPKQLVNYLLQYMNGNDRLFVTEVSDNYAHYNLRADPKAA